MRLPSVYVSTMALRSSFASLSLALPRSLSIWWSAARSQGHRVSTRILGNSALDVIDSYDFGVER